MSVELSKHQLTAIDMMRNGSILCGGVGSGKSRTALAYYILKECCGNAAILSGDKTIGRFREMEKPRDLYIITTAKKRDSLEWDKECASFVLGKTKETNAYGVKVFIDSWNNIKKYKDVVGGFFIFDEQRVVGSGTWVKTFLDITRKNHWVLLSATPGDQWKDYIPVFVANGFYRNKTEFNSRHCVFSRFSKYPKIEKYINEKYLRQCRDQILIPLKDNRKTIRHKIIEPVGYDKEQYRTIFRDRWNPYENEPIEETGKLLYLTRRCVNSHLSRIEAVSKIVRLRKRVIIFYNYTYELEALREYLNEIRYTYSEWNGQKHEEVPFGDEWVYLVQYSAGSEGWNCIETNTIIFYSQNYSYRMTEQASGRIDRMNSPYTDLYYYILKSNSPIDLAIGRALAQKKNFNERSFVK